MEEQKFNLEEVEQASLEYFNGDNLATKVWISKYALKDSSGNFYEKTPDDMHRRLAENIAKIESKYPYPLSEEKIFNLFKNFKYIIPQENSLIGIGNNHQIKFLSDCFVIGLDENAVSYEEIIKLATQQIKLIQNNGDVGHDLSYILPKELPKEFSTKDIPTSAIGFKSFIENNFDFDKTNRQHFLMLNASCKHPGLDNFIATKESLKHQENHLGFSIKIDDNFMDAAIHNKQYTQQYPINSKKPKYTKDIDASGLWKNIVYHTWKSTSPNILFWDTIIKESISDSYTNLGYRTVAANKNSEIPLSSYESCRLLDINLYSYVEKPFTPEAYFDFDLFREHGMLAQRIMDDIIDIELENIKTKKEEIKSKSNNNDIDKIELQLWDKINDKITQGRRTGISTTGEGDMLAALGLQYGTEEAIELSEQIHKTLALAVYRSSVNMAKDRGKFQLYNSDNETDNPFVLRIKDADKELYENMIKYGRRNIACLTISPASSTNILAQVTSGIEPVNTVVYKQQIKPDSNTEETNNESWQTNIQYHSKFKVWMETNGYSTTKSYSNDEIDELLTQSPYNKASLNNIEWEVKLQAVEKIQKWVDHIVCLNINLPNDTTEDTVKQIFEEAWKRGCKAIKIHKTATTKEEEVLDYSETDNKITITESQIEEAKNDITNNDDDTTIQRNIEIEEKSKDEDEDEDKPKAINIVDKEIKKETIIEPVNLEILHNMKEEMKEGSITTKRPVELDCDIVRFQNEQSQWVAFVGLLNGKPYEIFTGLADDEEGILLPSSVVRGKIIKVKEVDVNGTKSRYDFQYINKRGYKTTIEGLSYKFNSEYWNYAKLISALLRYQMPINLVIKLVSSLQINSTTPSINTWKNGVLKTLEKYITTRV